LLLRVAGQDVCLMSPLANATFGMNKAVGRSVIQSKAPLVTTGPLILHLWAIRSR